MIADIPLVVAGASAACGSAVLRFAWSRPRRSLPWNVAGWGLFGLAILAGWLAAGAWGVAVANLWGMGVAMILLSHAALTSPAAAGAKASNRRVNMLPQGGEPLRLVRRIVTFLIVALIAMIVSIGLAMATRSLLIWFAASEANANVAGLFIMPVAWALLSYTLLMEERRMRQWRLLLIYAVPGILALVTGLAT